MRIGITSLTHRNHQAAWLTLALAEKGHTVFPLVGRPKNGNAAKLRSAVKRAIKRRLRRTTRKESSGECYESIGSIALDRWGISVDRDLAFFASRSGGEVVCAKGINSGEMVRAIVSLDIELVINAGGGIFRRSFLEAVPAGVLNAHMGLLPDFRGMNVLEWSLFEKKPIGVTVHKIDEGIDTGPVYNFHEIHKSVDDTISSLRRRAGILTPQLLVNLVDEICKTDRQPDRQVNSGPQYFVMHPRMRVIAEQRIAASGVVEQ